ncbi:MAG: penicillin-binding protein 2 [Minwuiales bacterium]|nr:penicillin-binding protein 2 [Minwuiales bacterium]
MMRTMKRSGTSGSRRPAKRTRRAGRPIDVAKPSVCIKLEGTGKQAVETGRARMAIASLVFAVCFVTLSLRLVDLTLFQGGAEPTRADRSAGALAGGASVGRAPIVDRNDVLLAVNLRTASLSARPHLVPDPAEAATQLARILPSPSQDELLRRLSSNQRFTWLRRGLTPDQQQAVNSLGIPGLDFDYEERRIYPHGSLAAHVLGGTDLDNTGIAGVEKWFNDDLMQSASSGGDLTLSLDINVQHAMRDELLRAVEEFEAIGAVGIVLDVQNGEVLSMVSLPDFDPNISGEAKDDRRFNRATLGVYEMGSTFKTFTAAMALDAGTIGMAGGYDATRPLRADRHLIRDFHAKRRWLSVPEIYMYSSNIGAAKMAEAVGTEGQQDFMYRLGMLTKPTVELPEVSAPLLPGQWLQVETLTIAFGHGLSVSPLQLASGIATIVNGGLAVQSTVIKRENGQPFAAVPVISERTSDQMRRLMRLVVEHGTGRRAAAPGYLVGGKTGTAEKPVDGRYDRDALITSFVAAFPMTAPRYVVLAMIDEPKGNEATGGGAGAGVTAAPVTGRVIRRIAPLLGVDPVDEEDEAVQQALEIKINSRDPKVASF